MFFGIDFRSLYWLVGAPPIIAKYSVQVAKNEMWVREVCFACLTWLYGLFVRTLIPVTNAYAGCGRPTLNFIERFWLGSVHSSSMCTQMNYKMNWITIHNCTAEMHSKRPEYNGECQSCLPSIVLTRHLKCKPNVYVRVTELLSPSDWDVFV